MNLLKRAAFRLHRLWNPERVGHEIDEELRFHVEMEARDLMRRGVPADEARRRATRNLGRPERIRDDARASRGWLRLEDLVIDTRQALRQTRRAPGFTALVVVTLALGIGANAAIFSVVYNVVMRSLPYAEPERLVTIKEYATERGVPAPGAWGAVSYLNFRDWRDAPVADELFEEMALRASSGYLMLGAGEPADVRGALVTPNYFRFLGVGAALGRAIEPGEQERVVVLSDSLWRTAFGADPGALGESVRLDGEPFVVIGVMPAWFEADGLQRLWIPLTADNHPLLGQRRTRAYFVMARLGEGVTIEQARAATQTLRDGLAEAYPEDNEAWGIQVIGLHEDVVGAVRPTLLLLFGAVGLLLLLACANVANLLLARASGRRQETALRAALGAGRRRIVQQLLTESVLLALLGGAVGLALGAWGTRIILALTPTDIPRLHEPAAGAGVLLFTLGISIATGLLFGVAPALQGSAELFAPLRRGAGGAGGGAGRGRRLRGALVVAEVALSLVLLIAAGLLVSSFAYLWGYEPGFDAGNVLTMGLGLDGDRYPEPALQDAFYEQLYARLRAAPQVEAVGGITRLPVGSGNIQIGIEGQGSPLVEGGLLVNLRPISGDYFDALRVPVLAGRAFEPLDADAVILNELAARRLWPGEAAVSAVGRSVRFPLRDREAPWLRVVGVVGATRHGGLDPDPLPEVYQPHAQRSFGYNVVVIRTRGDPLEAAEPARAAVHAIDPQQPVGEIRTMRQVVADSMRRPRFYATLFSAFGMLALFMAAAGVFGMAAYATRSRRREIGVRIALGARRGDVLRLVLFGGARLVAAGMAIGLGAALALGRYAEGLLYGITATDPESIVMAVAVLATASFIGFYLPARRATRVDPTEALRGE